MVNKKIIDVVNTFITNPLVECINFDQQQLIMLVDDTLISSVLSYANSIGFKKFLLSLNYQDGYTQILFII